MASFDFYTPLSKRYNNHSTPNFIPHGLQKINLIILHTFFTPLINEKPHLSLHTLTCTWTDTQMPLITHNHILPSIPINTPPNLCRITRSVENRKQTYTFTFGSSPCFYLVFTTLFTKYTL